MHKHRTLLAPLFILCLLTNGGCSQSEPAATTEPASTALPAAQPASAADADHAGSTTAQVPAALQHTTTSGFLGDYSKLQLNPNHAVSLIQRADKLASYKTFMIETPTILPTATIRGGAIPASSAAQLAVDLKAAASDALGVNFKVTDRANQGVAKVRLAVTQIAECSYQTDGTGMIGGASVEMEIVDSLTGERLAAATESDAVTTRDADTGVAGPYYDARLVFRHWAARLAKSLTDAQQ